MTGWMCLKLDYSWVFLGGLVCTVAQMAVAVKQHMPENMMNFCGNVENAGVLPFPPQVIRTLD